MRKRFSLLFFGAALHAEICLVMVVHNDEAVIERTLDSVKDVVDCICIYNQGCSDDTLVLIDAFKRDAAIPVLIAYPEENNESAPNAALHAAQVLLKNMKWPLEKSYLLFLQPGSVLEHGETLRTKTLSVDAYSCVHAYPTLKLAKRYPILLKASLAWEGEGSFIQEWKAAGAESERLDALTVLHTEELSHFLKGTDETLYLAQLLIARKEYAAAIELHQTHMSQSRNPEEVWFSHLMIAHCYEALDEWELALHWYLETYQYNPSRAEPLLKCATYYRTHGDNHLAYLFAHQGLRIGAADFPSLTTAPLLQAYEFEEELSIAAFYTQYRTEGEAAANNLILRKNVPWFIKEQTYKNLLFYVEKLTPLRSMPIDFELPLIAEGAEERFHPMNPSMRKTKEGYQVVCRSVNYQQQGAKSFSTSDPTGVFRTRNFLLDYDCFFQLQSTKEIIENLPRTRIRSFNLEGLDDCRIFAFNEELWFSCNTGDTNPCGTFQISLCKLANESQGAQIHVEKLIPLKGPDPYRCEKNWLPFISEGVLSFIYSCEPFVLYTPDLKSGSCLMTLSYENNYDFTHFRGSAAPTPFDNGYLMLVHEVVLKEDYSRCYLHRFLFLDDTLRITKISKPFFFDHHGVEYCCSMTLDHSGKQLVLAIGLEDREAHLCFHDCNKIRSLLYSLKDTSHVFDH